MAIFQASSVKYIYIVLYPVSKTPFILQNWSSVPIKQHLPTAPSPSPSNYPSTLCLCGPF